jgi:hypothetical protein
MPAGEPSSIRITGESNLWKELGDSHSHRRLDRGVSWFLVVFLASSLQQTPMARDRS